MQRHHQRVFARRVVVLRHEYREPAAFVRCVAGVQNAGLDVGARGAGRQAVKQGLIVAAVGHRGRNG